MPRVFPVEPIPERIGAYKVIRRIGAPGPSESFLGRVEGPRGFQRACVLKRMKNTSEGSERLAEELSREAAICARINHPAIVRMIDFFEEDDKLVLALEHVEGVSLGELLEQLAEQRLKLSDAASFHIAHRVAGALAHAHAATDEQGAPTPIIHRDVHPGNVMISIEGDVRLTGFGVGKILGRTPDTAIGLIKGTPGYMAPEQARGEPVTAKADTYAVGLLLWELLSGRKPPSDGTWPVAINTLRTDLPREIVAIIDASLDRFPGTRKITCREIEQWLGKVVSGDKGKNELKEKVLAVRPEGAEILDEAPASARAPSLADVTPMPANPFQGVRFGPPAAPTPRPAEARVEARGGRLDRVPPPPPLEKPAPPPPPAPPAPPPAKVIVNAPAPAAPTPAPVPVIAPPIPAPPISAPVIAAPVADAAPAIRFGEPPSATSAAPAAAPAPAKAPLPMTMPPPEDMVIPKNALPFIKAPGAPAPPSALPVSSPRSTSSRPPPRMSMIPGLKRPVSTFRTMIISAVTATVVVILAFVYRDLHSRPAPAAPEAEPLASAAPPVATAAPEATAAAAPAPSAAPAAPSVADLPAGFGYLKVISPAVARVYISGKPLGPANEMLQVRCGRWFVRLASPADGRYPEWVSRGETVDVGCQDTTQIEIKPSPTTPTSFGANTKSGRNR